MLLLGVDLPDTLPQDNSGDAHPTNEEDPVPNFCRRVLGCTLSEVEPKAKDKFLERFQAGGSAGSGVPLIGDKVVYFSGSHKRWLPTIITDVGDGDEVELEIKPGVTGHGN